jgi:hypothetical protein
MAEAKKKSSKKKATKKSPTQKQKQKQSQKVVVNINTRSGSKSSGKRKTSTRTVKKTQYVPVNVDQSNAAVYGELLNQRIALDNLRVAQMNNSNPVSAPQQNTNTPAATYRSIQTNTTPIPSTTPVPSTTKSSATTKSSVATKSSATTTPSASELDFEINYYSPTESSVSRVSDVVKSYYNPPSIYSSSSTSMPSMIQSQTQTDKSKSRTLKTQTRGLEPVKVTGSTQTDKSQRTMKTQTRGLSRRTVTSSNKKEFSQFASKMGKELDIPIAGVSQLSTITKGTQTISPLSKPVSKEETTKALQRLSKQLEFEGAGPSNQPVVEGSKRGIKPTMKAKQASRKSPVDYDSDREDYVFKR